MKKYIHACYVCLGSLAIGCFCAFATAQTPPAAPAKAAPTAAAPAAAPASAAASTPAASATDSGTVKSVEINRAAKIVLLEGDARVLDGNRKRRTVALGDYVNEGDFIFTGANGEVHLDMEDGGYIAVRPNTRMRIAQYQAKGEDTDKGFFNLIEGSFRSVTGWIGKYNRNNYQVRTPNATVGVRGTDHEPMVIPAGATGGDEPGTYDKVNEGGSFIRSPNGRTDVAPNQAGFVSHDGKSKPRVLAAVPKSFKATRNEHLFMGKHAAVQKALDKRREGRRTEIKQKLNAGKPPAPPRQTLKEQREAAKKAKQDKQEEAKKKREDARKKREEEKEEKEAEKGQRRAGKK